MARVACAEGNVHAWDLARSLGTDYRPADPELVFEGWRAGTPQLRRPEAAGLLVAAPVQGGVWETMLYLFGRDPGWPA
jgi:hypothetical protein